MEGFIEIAEEPQLHAYCQEVSGIYVHKTVAAAQLVLATHPAISTLDYARL